MRVALVLFFLFWLLFSGHFDAWMLFLGLCAVIGSALFVRVLCGRYFLRLGVRRLWFGVCLLVDVFRCGLRLLGCLLRGDVLSWHVVRLDVSELCETDQVLFMMSVTLTPGTISCDLEDGVLEISVLFEDDLRSLQSGDLLRRVKRIGGK